MLKSVLIVAGGNGKRMSANMPKQFLPLNEEPVLMHTIRAFYNYERGIKIFVALNSEWHFYWQQLCAELQFTIPHILTEGGSNRFESVKNGLTHISNEGLIAIHDGARPLVSKELISKCFSEARIYGNATPAVPVGDSMREINGLDNHAVDRAKFAFIQTPQVFWAEIIKLAYEINYNPAFTDDASVVESQGLAIKLIPGDPRNIKITSPDDLRIAQLL